MRNLKILELVGWIGLFLLLNYFDTTYPKENIVNNVTLDFPYIMYGKQTSDSKEYLRVKIVTINYEGNIGTYISRGSSPINALTGLKFSVSNKNRIVSTSPLTSLYNNSYILVKTYSSIIEDVQLAVPYSRIIKGSTLCQKLSEEVIEQQGVLGIKLQKVKKYFEGKKLVAEEVIEESLTQAPRPEIIVIEGPDDTPLEVPQRGYNCSFWNAYVNSLNATAEEKQWLIFTMYGESGCNAESNKSYYKGLFQWDPCIWYNQYPNDNIFDGEAQIRHTLEKLKAGANPAKMWPAVYKRYVQKYGELSWLKN